VLFAASDSNYGRTNVVKHKIATGSVHPIKQPPRRLPDVLVKGMLNNEVITPSSSPWSSPVVLVRKKDGTTRFCVDYRRLNAVTINDAYPLPHIDDSFDHLSGSCWFSTLDLCSSNFRSFSVSLCKHFASFENFTLNFYNTHRIP
jgi:hypothetical protein